MSTNVQLPRTPTSNATVVSIFKTSSNANLQAQGGATLYPLPLNQSTYAGTPVESGSTRYPSNKLIIDDVVVADTAYAGGHKFVKVPTCHRNSIKACDKETISSAVQSINFKDTKTEMRIIVFPLLIISRASAFTNIFSGSALKTQINLFNGGTSDVLDATAGQKITRLRQGIPREILENLEAGVSLPFDFEHKESSTSSPKTIRVKQLEKDDVTVAVGLCLKEYGSYPSNAPKNDDPLSKLIQSKMDDFDNFLFSFVVLLGLGQRVERREKSDLNPSFPQDHNVICISEIDINQNEQMIGMAEVSLQPPDPARTSPPFVVPTAFKKFFSFIYGAPDPTPYISNVLITNEFRRKGYSKVLMACCEGLAKNWGYDEAYLHVDADQRSGATAQRLYRSIGYMPVVDEKYNQNFAWMGIDSVNRGLYIVDGVALLFLKKDLK